MNTAHEILGGGMYPEEVGINIEVVSRQEALKAMKEFSSQENSELKKSIRYMISLFKKYQINYKNTLYPHELKEFERIINQTKNAQKP